MFLKTIEIDNYMSFGRGVKVDFDDSLSEVLLVGTSDLEGCDSNGSGKTNFASAAFWCIFGIPLVEDASADDIIRIGETECSVSVTLEVDNNLVSIQRVRTDSGENSLKFYINNVLVNKKTSVPTEVQKDINAYFNLNGTPKQLVADILSTNFLSYNSVDMFVSKRVSSADRFAFISRMFNLDKWVECKEEAHKLIEETSPNLSVLLGQLNIIDDNLSKTNPEALLKENTLLQAELLSQEEQLHTYSSISAQLDILKTRTQSTKESLSRETSILSTYRADISARLQALLADERETTENINLQNTIIKNSFPQYSVKQLQNKKEEEDKKRAQTDEQKNTLTLERLSHVSVLDALVKTKTGELKCPNCNSSLLYKNNTLQQFSLNEVIKDIEKEELIIADITNKVITLEASIKESNLLIQRYNQCLDAHASLQASTTILKRLQKEIENEKNRYETVIVAKEKEIFQISLTLNTLNDEIATLLKQNNDIVFKESSLKNEISKLRETIITNTARINTYNDNIVKKKELTKKKSLLEKKIETYKFWQKSFMDIRRMLIQSILPQLETRANFYLQEMGVPFEIVLDTLREQKTTKTLKEEFNIKVIDKSLGTQMPIYLRSTGERKRIGVAVCMALLDLKSNTGSKNLCFRFFDEVLDNLDRAGIDAFLTVLENTSYQNFVISHNDSLKSRFTKIIHITKKNGVSYAKA